MKRILATITRLRDDSERGAGLVMVIILGMVMMAFVATASIVAVSGMRKASTDQDWVAAMSAAYAGVDDYQSRLSNDPAYVAYRNPSAPFSATSTGDLPTGTAENPAFGLGTTGSWATVAGSDGRAEYRYEVDNSDYSKSGILRLRSTGRVDGETRSIVANLKQQGFIDFLYFTDYEIQDPKYSGANATNCTKYAWAGRSSSGCSEIAFGNNDTVKGPVHSNDVIRICDARFTGVVSTAYNPASGKKYRAKDSNDNSCSGQRFDIAGSPKYAPVIGMPPTNSEMRKEVRYDLTTQGVARPGCLYTGPTSIEFHDNGTMTVRSPLTKYTQINGAVPPVGQNATECGTPGSGTGKLGSTSGQTISVLDRNLMFVQNVPSDPNDPNFTSTSVVPTNCETGSWRNPVTSNGIGYPVSGEKYQFGDDAQNYNCRYGDVFVEGDFHGLMTIAAENFVYITDDIRYEDSQADMLGLVGNNAVWVWNPVNSYGNSLLPYGSRNDRRIDAAILSVAHTFQVQNYSHGGFRGTLTVNGAIAQKFRGIVYSGSGYTKNYVYDKRFRYMAPPKFLSPVTTTYGVSELVEVKAAFNADGSAT